MTRKAPLARWRSSAKRIKQRIWFQRCHPAPLEPCGCVAYFDTMGRLQFHVTSQAPHVYRTALSLVTGIAEDKIHVMSPDLGGGFGNKVPVYPGYVCAIVGALKIGRPVKWIETRTENLTSTGFARDYHMDVEIGATADGKVTALKVATTADHGAFDAAADPTSTRRASSASSPAATIFRWPRRGRRVLHEQGAGRDRLPLLVPRHGSELRDRARQWTSWPTSWAWMRWSCASGGLHPQGPAKRDTRFPADDHDRSGESLLPPGGGRVAPREAAADDHD